MGNLTGNINKKASTISKNIKTEEKCENTLGWKEQSNTNRTNYTTLRDKSEGNGERRNIKKIPR